MFIRGHNKSAPIQFVLRTFIMPVPIMFPIEVTSREFDARLLLAAYCAGPDRPVFLGQDRGIYRLARRWRGGIYVGKQVLVGGQKPNLTKYRVLKERGFRVLFLAEEEPVFSEESKVDRKQFLQMFHPDWLDGDDVICAWGDFSAEVFREAARKDAAAIHVTGHPRFDLCKPELAGMYDSETRSIRQRFGKFILLNTKFALASNLPAFTSVKNAFAEKKQQEDAAEYWLRFYCYHARMQTAYIVLANRLRKEFPDHHIVLRPHPGEDPAWYRGVLAGIDNVSVLTEGSVLPWLAAAEVLVHTGCTTGLEACYLTPQIIQYAPDVGYVFEQHLPSLVGAVCDTEDEVVREIKDGRRSAIEPAAERRISRIIANFSPQLMSSKLIGDLVVAEAEKMSGTSSHGRIAELEHLARSLIQPRNQRRRSAGGVPKKFEPFDQESINGKLRLLESLVHKRLHCRYISPFLVEISSSGDSGV